MMNDVDLEDTISSIKRKARIDFGEKLDAADEDFGSSYRRRELKLISSAGANDDFAEVKSAASKRASASRARLDDLETEMFDRSEKQAARDKRSAHLKQFLADELDSDRTQSSTKAIKISSRSEKKVVSF